MYQGAKNSTSIRGLLLTLSSKVAEVSLRTSEAVSPRTREAKARRHTGEETEERRMVKRRRGEETCLV
jgi:hypothetical protein